MYSPQKISKSKDVYNIYVISWSTESDNKRREDKKKDTLDEKVLKCTHVRMVA